MKQPKKPTREQRKIIQGMNLNPADWLIERDTPEKMVLVHRYSDRTTKTIHKE